MFIEWLMNIHEFLFLGCCFFTQLADEAVIHINESKFEHSNSSS